MSKIDKIDKKIETLKRSLEKAHNNSDPDASFGYEFMENLETIPEMIPAAFLPALLGIDLYSDIIDDDKLSKPARVAMMALASGLAVPCFLLTALLAAPVAAIAIPASAAFAGVKKAQQGIIERRIKKIPAAIEQLEAEKEKITSETRTTPKI